MEGTGKHQQTHTVIVISINQLIYPVGHTKKEGLVV